ncbi:hypothetical protein LXL04_027876 [Taraxacum kok-saghyz]
MGIDAVKPSPVPIKEENSSNQSTSLLSFDTDISTATTAAEPSTTTVLLFSLLLSTCIALSAAVAFAILFFSSIRSTNHHHTSTAIQIARPLTKLTHPVVILISSDGFRFGYQFKTPTPNIHRLINNGTEAETGLIPVYPTLTFPNHYSIATGLYPAYHGIINNKFIDPIAGDSFTMASHEPKWWLGEPIWETIANHGLKAATYFWPGSEVKKGLWDCPVNYCAPYNESVPFEERVDTVLNYFDLPNPDIPIFMTLYFEDPDHQGHQVGPDDPQITEAISHIDALIGRLIKGLEKRGVFEDVTIIMVGDHGMVGTCDQKVIFLDDLSSWINIPTQWVKDYTPVLSIRPPSDQSPSEIVAKMNQGLSSGKVKNGDKLKVYLKEDLPKRLHYWDSDRIPPIIGLVAEGFKIEQKDLESKECGGSHGYDNAFFSMRTIFIGHGPRFPRGSFQQWVIIICKECAFASSLTPFLYQEMHKPIINLLDVPRTIEF